MFGGGYQRGGWLFVHAILDRLGRASARRHWWVIAAWLVILVAVLLLRSGFGGQYVNNYTVPGTVL